MENFKDNMVLIGTVNPKGLPDGTKTTYFTESEVHRAAKKMRDRRSKPIPVYIDHKTKDDKGKPIQPCGFVWYGKVREDNGKLYAVVVLHNNENGKLAKELINHKTCPMREFSLGYDILMEDKNGSLDVKGLDVKELSICYKGVQKTDMSIITTVGEILNKDTTNASMPKNNENLINHKKQNLLNQTNQTNQTNQPTQSSQKMEIGYDETKHSNIARFYNNKSEYDADPVRGVNPDTHRDIILNQFAAEMQRYNQPQGYSMHATAAAGDEMQQEQVQTSNTSQLVDSLVAQYQQQVKQGAPVDSKFEELIQGLKKYSVPQGKSDLAPALNTPAPSMNVVKKNKQDQWEAVKATRKPQSEFTPEQWEREARLRELEDQDFERQIQEIDGRMSKMNAAIQTKLRSILPALLKANEQNANGLQPQDVQVVENFFSNAASTGPQAADSLVKFIEASASFANENTAFSHKAADSINDLFTRYKSTEALNLEQLQLIDKMKKELENMKKENDALKNATNKPVQPTLDSSYGIGRESNVKKMKLQSNASAASVSASTPSEFWGQAANTSNSSSFGGMTGLSRYGQQVLVASVTNNPKEPLSSHLARAGKWDEMFTNPMVKTHDINAYQDELFKRAPPGYFPDVKWENGRAQY